MYKKVNSHAKSIMLNPLFSGSAIMIVGSNLANFFAYIYHFILGRMLGRELYGEIVAFLSLIAILSSTYSFANLVVVKFVSSANKKDKEKLFSWFMHKTVRIGIIAALVLLLLTPLFNRLLHMNLNILVFVSPIFFFSLVLFIYRSFLQGILHFVQYVIVSNIEFLGRLIIGVLLVLVGFSVLGAVCGILFSVILATFVARRYLKDYRLTGVDKTFKPDKKIFKYAFVILVNTIAITSLYSMDILLVKHYFSAGDAGIYAATSTLGKTILFASIPISSVMFPIISARHAKGEKYLKIFWMSLLMTVGVSALILILFLVLPSLAVNVLYGQDFLLAANYLFIYGVFITIFSVNYLFLNYFLSIEKNRVVIISAIAAVAQIIGIIAFHYSLSSVITISIIVSVLMLCCLLIYFVHETKTSKKIS